MTEFLKEDEGKQCRSANKNTSTFGKGLNKVESKINEVSIKKNQDINENNESAQLLQKQLSETNNKLQNIFIKLKQTQNKILPTKNFVKYVKLIEELKQKKSTETFDHNQLTKIVNLLRKLNIDTNLHKNRGKGSHKILTSGLKIGDEENFTLSKQTQNRHILPLFEKVLQNIFIHFFLIT